VKQTRIFAWAGRNVSKRSNEHRHEARPLLSCGNA
jgi:hypothetical protein